MTPEEIAKNVALKDAFVTKDDIYRMLATVAYKQLKWVESLWSDDIKVRAANELYLKKHPHEAKARERSLAWFARFATVSPNGKDKDEDLASLKDPRHLDPRHLTTDALEKLNLPDEELRRLAGIEEPKQ